MRLGIDFGTTNSAVAYFDGENIVPVEIDPSGSPADILPSLIYIDREAQDFVGLEAMRVYASRETGRPVQWRRKLIGEFEVMVAGTGGSPIVFWQEAYAFVDEAALGRLLQSVKTALRDPNYQGTQIFERFYTLDELLAILLSALKAHAERQFGQPCTEIVLGRPVRFTGDAASDRRAEEILYKAARWVGFQDIRFQAEPIGAMMLYHQASVERQRVLVFDFGGGTLDFTVADVGGNEAPHILATHGVLVGGDDLDKAIMRYLLKYFGEGTKIGRQPFPYDILDLLLSWQTMPEVSRPEHHEILHDFRTKSNNPKAIAALEKLVQHKLGFALFKEIERVKKELSSAAIGLISFRHEPIRIQETISRGQFERMIAPELRLVEEGLLATLDKAGINADAVDVVLRTGGSSQIPVFVNLLSKHFGREKLREMEALTSIVGGLAIEAAQDIGTEPVYKPRYPDADAIGTVVTGIESLIGSRIEPFLLRVGEAPYFDIETSLMRVPVELSRLPALRVMQADYQVQAEAEIRFRLQIPAMVYVGYTATASTLPHWLRDFEQTDAEILTDDPWYGKKRYTLYKRPFAAGEVVLGGTQAEGYGGKVNLHYMVVIAADC